MNIFTSWIHLIPNYATFNFTSPPLLLGTYSNNFFGSRCALVCKTGHSSMLFKHMARFVTGAVSPVLGRRGVWWEQDVLDDTGVALCVRVAADVLWKHSQCSGNHMVPVAALHAPQTRVETVARGRQRVFVSPSWAAPSPC